MPEFLGTALVVQWGGTPLPQVTRCTITDRGDRPRIEVTHASDTARQYLDDLPESPQTDITVAGFMETGTVSVVRLLTPDIALGSIAIYPWGTAAGANFYYGTAVGVINRNLGDEFRVAWPYEIQFRRNLGALTVGVTE